MMGIDVVRGAAPYNIAEYIDVGCVPRTVEFGSSTNFAIVCNINMILRGG